MKLLCRYDGTHLIPSSADSVEAWEKLKNGQEYLVETKKARNPGHHRKAMKLLTDVFHSQEKYKNFDDLLIEFKLCTGWYKEHITMKGEVVYTPKSISFSQMDQTTFEEFYSRAIDVAINRFGYEAAVEYV
jgi:hypothetical protein